MALQSSGQIKFSEVNTELGRTSTTALSIKDAATGAYDAINTNSASYPDSLKPHAISEWYSYDHNALPPYSNDYYYSNDGVNDYIKGIWENYNSLHNTDWSISFWVRQNQTSAASQQLWDFNANSTLNSGNTTNRVFLQYNGNLNRFIVRIRTSSANFDRQWALHDNSSVTGVSSSGWTSSNRGNVNSDGFCLLTVTYDASQTTATNAIKMYWNGSELTSQAASNNGTRSSATFASLSLCASQHNISGGNANVDIDEWAFYSDILTSSEATTIYNSGTIETPENLHTNNLQEVVSFAANNAIDTYTGIYSGTISGGTTTAY